MMPFFNVILEKLKKLKEKEPVQKPLYAEIPVPQNVPQEKLEKDTIDIVIQL